ncbi:unnamed protein product [Nippostrongylus brasiliensis]|uniref:DUF1336 domain-containing protein n=1 Tax=Nippostrongylus brasiliensis TaxID=27835 RepID=A0A0N4Y6C5_NIPBR|nr:unnamed protein product [Nippostrongylus brasiliensis]
MAFRVTVSLTVSHRTTSRCSRAPASSLERPDNMPTLGIFRPLKRDLQKQKYLFDGALALVASGNARSQIDYVLVRRRDAKFVCDAKVVSYETAATQHRPFICTMKFTPPMQMRVERCGHGRIKRWRLREKEAEVIGGIRMALIVDVDGTWHMKTVG